MQKLLTWFVVAVIAGAGLLYVAPLILPVPDFYANFFRGDPNKIEFLGKTFVNLTPTPNAASWEFAPEGETEAPLELITIVPAGGEATAGGLEAFSASIREIFVNSGAEIIREKNYAPGEEGVRGNTYFMLAVFYNPEIQQAEVDFLKIFVGEQGIVTNLYTRKFNNASEDIAEARSFIQDESAAIERNFIAASFVDPVEFSRLPEPEPASGAESQE